MNEAYGSSLACASEYHVYYRLCTTHATVRQEEALRVGVWTHSNTCPYRFLSYLPYLPIVNCVSVPIVNVSVTPFLGIRGQGQGLVNLFLELTNKV